MRVNVRLILHCLVRAFPRLVIHLGILLDAVGMLLSNTAQGCDGIGIHISWISTVIVLLFMFSYVCRSWLAYASSYMIMNMHETIMKKTECSFLFSNKERGLTYHEILSISINRLKNILR